MGRVEAVITIVISGVATLGTVLLCEITAAVHVSMRQQANVCNSPKIHEFYRIMENFSKGLNLVILYFEHVEDDYVTHPQ